MLRKSLLVRATVVLALSVAMLDSGCGSGGNGDRAGSELGFDDGASLGQKMSTLVTGEKEVVMELSSGAKVSVPKGALDEPVTLELKRPKDSEALALVMDLRKDERLASAPYVVTPHGTQFKIDVEVTLPIADGRDKQRLRVLWLEDEKDRTWEELGKPKVAGDKASFTVGHFSVLLLVEGDTPDTNRDSGVDASDHRDAAPAAGNGEGLPFDLERDCAASGCTLAFTPIPYDGVWRECDYRGDASGFAPERFDFAAACATTLPADGEGHEAFVHDGLTRSLDIGTCDVSSQVISAEGGLYDLDCAENYGAIARESGILVADTLYYYDDDDCDGACSPTLHVGVLERSDTSELNAACAAAAEVFETQCSNSTVVFPFGLSGIGSLPPMLADTLWITCGAEGDDPAIECAGVRAGPPSSSLQRFNADGTYDSLYYQDGSWAADDCGIQVGGEGASLRTVRCKDDFWAVVEGTWEVRTIDGVDYLLWNTADGDELPELYVAAPTGLSIPSGEEDPCAQAPRRECVIH